MTTHHDTSTRGTVTQTTNSYHRPPSDAPTAPSGCPVDHGWSPLADDYLTDPYPIAAHHRDHQPVFYAEQLGHVVVTQMEDIERVFMDPDVFASSNVQDPIWPLDPAASAVLAAPDFDPIAVMSNRAEPAHGRIRVYTRAGFSNRRLRPLEDYMRRRADELLAQMIADASPSEFVGAFAFPLPAEIVFRLLGFPPEDDAMIKSWCVNRKAFSWGRPTPAQQVEIAHGMLDYWRYCREFVAQRRDHRRDDFTSELLDAWEADPGPDRDPDATTGISYREVESVVYGISFAGHDPVTALLCNMLRCLLPRRDQWQAVVDDPSLAAKAVEETLRHESSQIGWRRVTTRATELGGVELPAGTRVYLNFAAANRQPDVFDRPDEFDLDRPNSGRHISFGKGIHFCLGSGLARMEARIALQQVAERLPSLRLVADQELAFFPNITFRGPDALLVEWN